MLNVPTTFTKPVTVIKSIDMLNFFLSSDVCANYIQFLEAVNESVVGLTTDAEVVVSPIVEKMITCINKCSVWIEETPCIEQPQRFGNKAFRLFCDKVEEASVGLMKEILPENNHDAAIEFATYFHAGLGNKIRIDYGTGHETAFAAWLYCFNQLGLITREDYPAIVLRVFYTYILFTRKFQKFYGLEPAGTQGVWSLDDHHFLIFFFGSAQLRGHKFILPKSLRDMEIVEDYYAKYMYIDAIRNIYKSKNGPFFEHSPILDSIMNVAHWEKVNGGMMKMYKDVVIGKFPVMQHFLFGNLIPYPK